VTATSTNDGVGVDAEETSTAVLPVPTSMALVPVRSPAPESTAQPAGAGLIAEAELAIDERRWRDAMRVLGAVQSIGASSVHTDGLLAVAATHLNRTRVAGEAIGRIKAAAQTVDTHRSLAAVALARHEFLTADNELRSAIDLASADDQALDVDDWARLASVYGGLGWFDEAGECLDRAEEIGAADHHRWIVGRSINHWAMSRSWALAVAVILFLPLGLLAIAVGLTVPFVARELRLTQIDERMAALAADAWSNERWLRIAHATGVLATVVLWSLAVQL
jgi:hypothetical protein